MRFLTAISAAAALAATTAEAQYTHVRAPSHGEANHAQILASALGGTFSAATSVDYSNGSIYADRMKDNTGTIGRGDRYWAAGTYHAKMVASEASYTHTFGAVEGTIGGGHLDTYAAVLDSGNIGSQATITMDEDFRWAIEADSGHRRWYDDGIDLYTSREWDNAGDKDHMVAYTLKRDGNVFGYMLFFEDLKYCPDKDYNDVAVLLTLVPTPQAAMMGLTGLGGLGLLAGRRRRETV